MILVTKKNIKIKNLQNTFQRDTEIHKPEVFLH